MRESPYGNRMKARQMFLDAHKCKIASDYSLPSSKLYFDDTVTEIVNGDKPIGQIAFDFLSSARGVKQILWIQKKHKSRLVECLDGAADYRAAWDAHMDYESIIMDKMIDLALLPPEVLVVPSGRTFYMQQRKFSLMHQGYQLAKKEPYNERAQWFSQWDDKWFVRFASTKMRLIDILQQYSPKWERDFAESNSPQMENLNETMEELRECQRRTMFQGARASQTIKRFKRDNPQLRNYMEFVTASLEYNEELRLLRSRSVMNLIEGAVDDGKVPYDVFIDVLVERKERFEQQYGER